MNNDDIYIISGTQGELFEIMAEFEDTFLQNVRVFLESKFCNREIDALYSCYQYAPAEDWIEMTQEEGLKVDVPLGTKYHSDLMAYWMGYMYRYLRYRSLLSSRELVSYISPEEMQKLYYDYADDPYEYSADCIYKKYLERYNQEACDTAKNKFKELYPAQFEKAFERKDAYLLRNDACCIGIDKKTGTVENVDFNKMGIRYLQESVPVDAEGNRC